MNLSAEAWLMLLALGLYLWDSALLLRPDELVLAQAGRGRWWPAFGANGWKLGGREPYLPNPFTPWRGLVRLTWTLEDLALPKPTAGGPRWPVVGRAPKLAVTVLLLLIFVALPTCLFVYPVLVVTLPVVAAIYLTCLLALATLRRDLEPGAFRKLFWECITCPPFCINAVRKACLRAPLRVALADVDPATVARQIGLRIREQIEAEAEGSERMARLQAVARALESRASA